MSKVKGIFGLFLAAGFGVLNGMSASEDMSHCSEKIQASQFLGLISKTNKSR